MSWGKIDSLFCCFISLGPTIFFLIVFCLCLEYSDYQSGVNHIHVTMFSLELDIFPQLSTINFNVYQERCHNIPYRTVWNVWNDYIQLKLSLYYFRPISVCDGQNWPNNLQGCPFCCGKHLDGLCVLDRRYLWCHHSDAGRL